MAPVRRLEGDPVRVYEEESDCFTLEVVHGGFFVGSGSNRAYVDGTKVCYDDCECDSWSALWLEDMIENLGYEAAGRIDVYWLLPGMQINEDGLRLINSDKDAWSMVCKVKDGHRYLMIYLDHEPANKRNAWDDVVHNPVAYLPAVISPVKKCGTVSKAIVEVHDPQGIESSLPVTESIGRRRSNRHAAVESDGEGGTDSDKDEDYVPDIIDSDNDIEDGDNDLYQQFADHEPMDEKVFEGDVSKDEFFEPGDSDEESDRFKNFKAFMPGDMIDPKFQIGQKFESTNQLKAAIRQHSCKHRKPIKFPKNDKTRVLAKCEPGCPWELYASWDSRTKSFVVKRYETKHTCEGKWQVRAFSARYIGKHYVEEIRANEKITLKGLAQLVQRDWKMTPKRGKLGRARKYAFEIIYGDETAQYNQLWDFGQELRRSNLGSTFFLLLDDVGHFKRCYFSFDACKRGFLAACRPIIFLDGCHLKTKFGGILLTAIGMDPNDCIFPVAFAIVEVENTSSWKWFLTALKQDLGIDNTAPWTIMSDKQKGLIKAVTELFPDSGHRFCVRHLWQNFNKNFKGEALKNQLWKCARSSTVGKWQENMDVMLVLSKTAHDWLEELAPSTWVRAFQSEFPKCDVLLNNNCEVFNKYILEARELPVLAMIMKIKCQITTRIYNKQVEGLSMSGTICPKIRKKLQKHVEWSNNCEAKPSGQGIFEILERGTPYIVDLQKRTCSCRRWDLSGIPCWHACSALRNDKNSPESYVSDCYSVEKFNKAYENIIWPCRDVKEWEKVDGMTIKAPQIVKKVGRPQKNRRKQPEEKEGKNGQKKMSKHGSIIHCSYCGLAGHNKGSCLDYKLGVVPNKETKKKVRAEPDVSDDDLEDVPLVTKVNQLHTMTFVQKDTHSYEPEMLNQLIAEGPCTQREAAEKGPLPDCAFIQENVLNQQPVQQTTITKEGNLLRKRQVLAAAKLKAVAHNRDVVDQAKFDAAMAKLQQEEELRAQAAETKKLEALARKKASEEKKKTEREAKQLAAEERKLANAEKKKKAQEEKLAAAQQKKLDLEARKKEAQEAKLALAEKRRLAQATRKQEIEEAKRKEEEDARNYANAQKLKRGEEARQKAWEEHLAAQSLRESNDKDLEARNAAWQEKKRVAQPVGMVKQKGASWQGSNSYNTTPYKKPRKASMFDYLKGPPPGCDNATPHEYTPDEQQ
ncbi:hypothetical protein ACQ4PT_036948 [Festuca glaucescens]